MRRCVYCGKELDSEAIVDMCEQCGMSVFGEKMFKAIVENMKKARERGDLYQSDLAIGETMGEDITQK